MSPTLLTVVAAAVALLATVPYLGVTEADFIGFDDPGYVVNNPMVNEGLRGEAVVEAFTTSRMANWHPLTWVSHMLDVSLFGLDAGAHHLVNVALHGAAAVLLLLALVTLVGGGLWPAALVAALFAAHPLRAESVAWISERKDVLSGALFMACLLAYGRWAHRDGGRGEKPAGGRLPTAALLLFALGLLAKPMVVTLPFVLLLLDAWPLGRVATRGWPALLREKLPFFGLAALSVVATVLAQDAGHSIKSTGLVSTGARLANAPVAVLHYVRDSLAPGELAFFYPHPAMVGEATSTGALLAGLALLVGVTFAALVLRRAAPGVLVGWLWFLGTLVPVVGLVQVGEQCHADRYTYLPGVGLGIALAFGLAALARRVPAARPAIVVVALAAVTHAAWRTPAQVATWQDSRTLYEHALTVAPDNPVVLTLLGALELDAGELDGAREHLEAAVALQPRLVKAHYNLGSAHLAAGDEAAAEAAFGRVLALAPEHSEAHNNLGVLLAGQGRLGEAVEHLKRAVAADPTNARARSNLEAVRARRKGRRSGDPAPSGG